MSVEKESKTVLTKMYKHCGLNKGYMYTYR